MNTILTPGPSGLRRGRLSGSRVTLIRLTPGPSPALANSRERGVSFGMAFGMAEIYCFNKYD